MHVGCRPPHGWVKLTGVTAGGCVGLVGVQGTFPQGGNCPSAYVEHPPFQPPPFTGAVGEGLLLGCGETAGCVGTTTCGGGVGLCIVFFS